MVAGDAIFLRFRGSSTVSAKSFQPDATSETRTMKQTKPLLDEYSASWIGEGREAIVTFDKNRVSNCYLMLEISS